MSNVLVVKEKIDLLANAISDKSGEPVTMTIDEMVDAVDSIEPDLQTGAKTYTPMPMRQNDILTPSSGFDGFDKVAITVEAVPSAKFYIGTESQYYTSSGQRMWRYRGYEDMDIAEGDQEGWLSSETRVGDWITRNAIPSNTSVAPTESSQTIGGANYMMEGAVTVNAIPSSYVGSGITQRSSSDLTANGATVTAPAGYYSSAATKSVASGTEGTPTASKGTVSNHAVTVTPSVTNSAGYISGGTKTGTGVSVSASELVSGTLSVTSSGTKDVTNYASASIPAGTEGTPIATKGSVSNHSVTVTPSVTNQTGFITGSTISGTGVSVSASELVSGNLAITQNGTGIDVSDYATVSVAVEGGGSSGGTMYGSATATPSSAGASITFTGLEDEPTSFVVTSDSDLATGASPYKTAAVVYDGTGLHGQTITNTSNAQVTYDGSGYTMSYSNGTLTITGTSAYFQANQYTLVYTYGGTATPNLWRPDYVINAYFNSQDVLAAYETDRTIYIPCKPNTTYTVKRKQQGNRYQVAYITSQTITTGVPLYGRKGASSQDDKINLTITTGADATFVVCYIWDQDSNPGVTPEEALEDVMISEGNPLNEYYPPFITNVYTSDVQVGSGATSITFTDLVNEPEYFSCIFKSNFSTSSGYQRVIEVTYDGSSVYGLEMDSGAKYSSTHWSYTYNNGSLTISSSGTNAGGYFHQPGYYQLTYAFGSDQSLQTKTVTPSTSTQNVTADAGYTALKKVVVNPIPSEYVIPTGNYPITSNGNNINIAQYATVSVNVPTGGGGGTVGTGSATLQTAGNSISFTNLSGTPKAWFIRCTTQLSSSGSTTYYYVVAARYNGTNTQASLFRIGSTRRVQDQTSGISYSYSGTTLTVSTTATSAGATPGYFYNGTYELTYVY